jgi:cytosine/adenosine deaminase-related metal-dependent hydrolase
MTGSENPQNAILIRGAAAIMTGMSGPARAAGPDIRIRGSTITAVGKLNAEPGERVIDATGCIVYPGWVNTHHHLMQTLLKGVPAGLNVPLRKWLDAVPFAFRMRFDEEMLETAALLGLAELMLSGCTTVADFHHLYYPQIGFDSSAVIFRAAEQLGIRLVLCRAFGTRARAAANPSPLTMPPEPLRAVLAAIERDAARWHDPAPNARRRVVAAPANITVAVEPGELREIADEMRRIGLRLHSHLAENDDDGNYCRDTFGVGPLQYAAQHGWVGADVWFAHMVKVDPADIRILAETGTGIAHCPSSNARLGNGIAPIMEMRAAGLPISLGQDGAAASDSSDMLAEAHFAWYIHRARGGPQALTIEEVLHWGTQGGARILGLDAVGVVATGFEADLAVYRLDDLRFAAFHDAAIAPVATGIRPYLKCLMVGGRVVVEDDVIRGIETDQLRRRAHAAMRCLMNE